MNDRHFFVLLVPLSLMTFLGIPTLLLTRFGPELRTEIQALTISSMKVQLAPDRPGTDQPWRKQQPQPLCTPAEEEALVEQLRAATEVAVLDSIIEQLWECWLSEEGVVARQFLDSGTELMQSGKLSAAARVFQTAVKQYPQWMEATNKLATVYFLQEKLHESAKLCRVVLEKKPYHFGAASGLVQVLLRLGEFVEAEVVASELVKLNNRLGEGALTMVRAAAMNQREGEGGEEGEL